jgi:hypothetical protein
MHSDLFKSLAYDKFVWRMFLDAFGLI